MGRARTRLREVEHLLARRESQHQTLAEAGLQQVDLVVLQSALSKMGYRNLGLSLTSSVQEIRRDGLFEALRKPVLIGSDIELGQIETDDLDSYYRVSLSPDVSHRWRFRGMTPERAVFDAISSEKVLCQFAVRRRDSGCTLGIVQAYEPQLIARHCWLAAIRVDHTERSSYVTEGALLVLDRLFYRYGMRKVYFEVPEYNEQFFGLQGWACKEARRREHAFHAGTWSDTFIFSVTDDYWRNDAREVFLFDAN